MTESSDLFSTLDYPRASNARRHSRHDILVIAFCTMLCGGQTCTDTELFGHAKRELLQSFLKLENGIPSYDTFSRLLGDAGPRRFPAVVHRLYAAVCRRQRGHTRGGRENLAPFLRPCGAALPAASGQRLVLGQVAVDAKSNAIAVLPRLLEMLTLRGKVVTAEAMHCQRQVAQQVIEQGGDYALALKGNQGRLRNDARLFRDDPSTPLAQDTQISKGHGRIETRIASVSSDVDWLQEAHHWPGL